ncbi:unnamed protein product [Spirodela intermedia]|uniref:Acetylcholinesterase n=1 Tax=Spirodela intermedia TaxID=51605 RepID=A0ABN7E9Z7_SPIIN|nr:unnamed protein product [Spirodela intermedia]
MFPRWYSGYNQIVIYLDYQENTSFTCPFGTYSLPSDSYVSDYK